MLNIQIDEQEVKQLAIGKIEEMLQDVEKDLVFWDRNELLRRTCLSWNTILDTFFYDQRFPKHKIGRKWLFPADEAKKFLLLWLSEQPTN